MRKTAADRALRVVHVLDNLLLGGTEGQCFELARGLHQLGVSNHVIYFSGGPRLEQFRAAGIPTLSFDIGTFTAPRFPLRVGHLARTLSRLRPHVVQSYGFYSNVPAALAGVLARTPARIASRRDLGDQRTPAQRRVDGWGYRLAHRIVANSDAVRRQLVDREKVSNKKVAVIRNGLDLEFWMGNEPGPADVPIVGMVANFRDQKDHPTFLAAAQQVLAVVPGVRFQLIGNGELEQATRAHAARLGIGDKVEFLGRLQGEALRAAVRRLHVSVLSSKDNEGLPNSVLESMAAGVPVVTTDVGGAGEVVEDSVSGFVIPPQSPAALRDRVLFLLKEPQAAREMGRRARARVQAMCSIDRMVSDFHALYRQVLGGHA
jgi:L-malate glycosyltransferase